MTELRLTEQQQNYLLCFTEEHPSRTINDLSQIFNCSRPNAKKMLDRMVKAGILYKLKNDYFVTEIGEVIKRKLEDKKELISFTIQEIFGIESDRAKKFSEELIGDEDNAIGRFLSKKTKLFQFLPEPSQTVSEDFLLRILDRGTYPLYLTVYQQRVKEREAAIAKSMANSVFDHRAELVIDDAPHVVFKTQTLRKEHKGYIKQGLLKELIYQRGGESHSIAFKDRRAEIPLSVFGEWTYLGGGILASYTWFRSLAAIKFSGHRGEANYLLVLNLAQC